MNWLVKVRGWQEATAFRGPAFDLKLGLKSYECLRAAAEICLRIWFERKFRLCLLPYSVDLFTRVKSA
jgi:hypothetical protein